jgi:hypothetical protein
VPLGWRYNPGLDTIGISGWDLARTRKSRNAQRHPDVALVVDDVLAAVAAPVRADPRHGGGPRGPDGEPPAPVIRLDPAEVISWGMEFAGE